MIGHRKPPAPLVVLLHGAADAHRLDADLIDPPTVDTRGNEKRAALSALDDRARALVHRIVADEIDDTLRGMEE